MPKSKAVLQSGRNMKISGRYGENCCIYINRNLCPECKFLNFADGKHLKTEIYSSIKFAMGLCICDFVKMINELK